MCSMMTSISSELNEIIRNHIFFFVFGYLNFFLHECMKLSRCRQDWLQMTNGNIELSSRDDWVVGEKGLLKGNYDELY